MARRAIKNMPMLLLMIPNLVDENTLHFWEIPSQPQPCIRATDNVLVSKGASGVDTGWFFLFVNIIFSKAQLVTMEKHYM